MQPFNDCILLDQHTFRNARIALLGCQTLQFFLSCTSVPPCSHYLRASQSWTHQQTQKGFSPFCRLLIQLLSLVKEQKSRFVTKGGAVCLQSSQKRATFKASVSLCPWQKIVDKFNLRNEFLLKTVI